ncbi:hypothetical protein BZG79_11470, partial [Salinivibrio sp. MA427]|uniref:hypothetical protein n=1 Tax=Salinivibrio sp. MA427 TaxID=1909455 RepID=UPI0009D44D61
VQDIKSICTTFNKILEMMQFSDDAYLSAVELRQSTRAKLLYNGREGNNLIKSHWGAIPNGWKFLPLTKVVEINPAYKVSSEIVKFCEMSQVATDSRFISGDLDSRSSRGEGLDIKTAIYYLLA